MDVSPGNNIVEAVVTSESDSRLFTDLVMIIVRMNSAEVMQRGCKSLLIPGHFERVNPTYLIPNDGQREIFRGSVVLDG
jgi:hypothetical protein